MANSDQGGFAIQVVVLIIIRIIKYMTLVMGLFFSGWRVAGGRNLIVCIMELRCIVSGCG